MEKEKQQPELIALEQNLDQQIAPSILLCYGTRPEYIKMKSLIEHMDNVQTCFTGQHQMMQHIEADYSIVIDPTESDNRLSNLWINILKRDIFEKVDYVMVQGDTTSACAMAVSAFHHGKKVIHLEAGLRTYDPDNPFPEEINRQIISRIATIHLCPHQNNMQNLLDEKVQGEIYIVGNTGLDTIDPNDTEYQNKVLITMHRRENHKYIDDWFAEFEKLANRYRDLEFILPLHPNPMFKKHCSIFKKVKIVKPMSHQEIITILKKCKFVISDSGGLQEECSFLNKKIIVCRKTTERPEIIGIVSYLCKQPSDLDAMVEMVNDNYVVNAECPYGDGKSWKKIIKLIHHSKNNLFYKL